MQFQNFEAAARKPNLKPFALMLQTQDLTWIAANYNTFELVSVAGVVDGANGTFTVGGDPDNGVVMFVNGVGHFAGIGFTLSGATVTFKPGYVPQTGDVIKALVF